MAQTITPIPAGGSWTTARTTINANDEIASDSMAILQLQKAPINNATFTGTHTIPSPFTLGATSVTTNGAELNILDGALVNYQELNKLVGIGTDTIATRAYARLVGGAGTTDTTYLSTRIDLKAPINNPNFTGVPLLATSDTLATQAYARSYGGTGTVVIGDVRDEIADSLNVLRPKTLVGNGTVGPFFDGSQDGGQILYFYGDNGFYTALQGGAPVANRSYRLPIAALPSAGTTSLMNIDEYGNMGFVAQSTVGSNLLTLTNPSAITFLRINANNTVDALNAANFKTALSLAASDVSLGNVTNESKATMFTSPIFTGTIPRLGSPVTDTLSTKAYARSVGGGDVSTLETRVDSIVDVLADTANIEAILLVDLDTDTLATKAYARSVGGGGGGVVGITLNSGTITLNGSEGTADDITFYTNGNGSYDLPAGGGNLTIMSQVQGWINDSLDNAKVDIRKFDSDTIPLFVFGLGSGHSADTALFNNGRLAGAFYNSGSDTLYVTELRGVLVEGTGTETIDVQVSWHTNMKDVSAINLNTTALTISNMTTGTSDVSFNNNGIPPGRWVWCVLSGASSGNKPTALMLTMTGYRRNRSY